MATRARLDLSLTVENENGPTLDYTPAPVTWAPATALANGQQTRVALTTGETTVSLPTGTVCVVVNTGANTNVKLRWATGETGVLLGSGTTLLNLSGVASFILYTSASTASVDVLCA